MHFFGRLVQFLLVVMTFSVFLTACMVGPDFHTPPSPQTKSYTRKPLPSKTASISRSGGAGKAQYFAQGGNLPEQWWYLFHSPAINALVSQGLANSPNVAAAQAALRQAQETLQAQVGSSLYPAISAQMIANRQAFSNAGFGDPGSKVFNFFNPSFNLAYTLDVFGGLRRQIEALGAQVDFQNFELEAAYLSLTVNIVSTAITSASLAAQIQATRELIKFQEATFRIVKGQFNRGGASGADVFSQATQIAQTRATLPPLEQRLAQSQHLLAVLVGVVPSQITLPLIDLNTLHLPGKIPVSLPSALAHQRPDIRASEALVHAASAQVGVATANLYPQVTLNGSYGWSQDHLAHLISDPNSVWSYGTQILQPLYNGGALRAKRRAAIAAFDQAAAQYRQTVLQGFQNVADSLKALQNDALAFRAQRQAEVAAQSTLTLTRKQYYLGGVNYLLLLDAERQYQQSRLGRIQAQAARYNDTVALFQALGGGWWNRKDESRSSSRGCS